jgi:hypothetical protein
MVSRADAVERWLAKSWSSDFFPALQRRLPLIILSSLALVLASFSSTVSTQAVGWATGAGVAFLLAFLNSFLVQIVRSTNTKASAIATVYGLTILGFLCLFAVAAEFTRVSWPAGVAYRFATRYGLTLISTLLFLLSTVPNAIDLFRPERRNTRVPTGARQRGVLGVVIVSFGLAGSVIMITSSVLDIVYGGAAPPNDILAWQGSGVALIAASVALGELVGRRSTQAVRRTGRRKTG